MAAEGWYPENVSFRSWAASFVKPRFLSLTIHTFIAFYVTFKFVLLVFRATSLWERWVFELTPAFLLGLPEIQLALISMVAAGTSAIFHQYRSTLLRFSAIALTMTMITGIILALRTSPYYFDQTNIARLTVLAFLLFTVPMDHLDFFRSRSRVPSAEPYPSYDYMGPEAPEDFDQVMGSVDEALGMLDTRVTGPSQDDAADRAANILEDLLASISEEPVVREDRAERELDPAEVERRRNLFEHRLLEMDDRLRADPRDVDALFAKATYLAMRKQYQEAAEALDEIARLSPYYPGIWHLKAKIYELMGNHQMAALCAKRAKALE